VKWGGGGGDTARQTIPVVLFMAGDIFSMPSPLARKALLLGGATGGIPWSMESLKAHALRLESGALNLNCVQDVCGVKEQPLSDAIDTDHFVPPTLHLTIGKGNDILENLTRELQAVGEAYSANYYETETNATLAILSLEKAKEELQHFNDGYCEYEIDLQRQKRGREGMMVDLRAIAEEELGDILLERVGMQDAVKNEKVVCRREEKGGELQGHRPASPRRHR
jgi:hypothetical protein